jgi:hypothetical protein
MLGMLDPKEVYQVKWAAGGYTPYRALVQLARAGGVLPFKGLTKHTRSRLDGWVKSGEVGKLKIADPAGWAYEMKPKGWALIEEVEAKYRAMYPEDVPGGGKQRHAKSPARKHRHREHRALVKAGWLPKSKLGEYDSARYDIYWNKDYTMFKPSKLLWWDDASYLRYQSEDRGDEMFGGKKRHAGGKARHSKWKRKETRAAIREYQRLLAIQRKMPESEMWHMGEALRQAKAKAYVEMEYERAFSGGKRRHSPVTGVTVAEKALRKALKG